MLREALEAVLGDERRFEEWVGRALTAPRRAPLGAAASWSALAAAEAAAAAEEAAAEAAAQAKVGAAMAAVVQAAVQVGGEEADEEPDESEVWGVAALVSGIAGGADEVLCHTPGRVFGFVEHADAGAAAGAQPGEGDAHGGEGAARSMFVDGERIPVEPAAAPFVPLLCSRSRLPPAVLRGPLSSSPALCRLVEELLRRDFLSVDMEL